MAFISVTRLRLRSLRFLPAFVPYTLRSRRQVMDAPGFTGGQLLADGAYTYWTLTSWNDGDSMRRYMTTGPHKLAMPRLMEWCDEASVVHWDQPNAALPSWADANKRMRDSGRPSKVCRPSAQHATMSFRAPWKIPPGPIAPATR